MNTSPNTNIHDTRYQKYLSKMEAYWIAVTDAQPVFTTSASGTELWDAYLTNVPDQQYHTCNACRRFVESYGGLVVICPDGSLSSPVWDVTSTPVSERKAIKAMLNLVLDSRVTGVFLSEEDVLGHPITGRGELAWQHWGLPNNQVWSSRTQTAESKMAEKLEDFGQVTRALGKYDLESLTKAVQILQADALYRSEKVLGPAQWLLDLKIMTEGTKHTRVRESLLWRAVATAPAGFCHPSSSMIGTLLDDLSSGLDFESCRGRFNDKMHPLQYQRPTELPSAGNVAAAEKLAEKLGITESLKRRFARWDEVELIWRPEDKEPGASGGVFSDLRTKDQKQKSVVEIPGGRITWVKFHRDVLPTAEKLELTPDYRDNWQVYLTATDSTAPMILQWDHPVSWYVWNSGSPTSQYGIRNGVWIRIVGISQLPCHWHGHRMPNQAERVCFHVDGARETRMPGSGLFPEILQSDLHGIRATIEQYSKTHDPSGIAESGPAGIAFPGGEINLRVTSGNIQTTYTLDRWE